MNTTDNERGMFAGLSAWFSSSVAEKRVNTWTEAEGTVDSADRAMYLFSEDADAEDTKRLYDSDAYLKEHLAIFHACLVDECVTKGGIKDVAPGKYFLPPAELHSAIKNQVTFKWELLAQAEKNTQQKETKQQKTKQSSQNQDHPPEPDNSASTSDEMNVRDVNQKEVTGNREVQPTGPQTRPQQPVITEPTPSTSKQDSNQPRRSTGSKDYVDIDDVPKIEGEINDFIIGKDGCQVLKILAV